MHWTHSTCHISALNLISVVKICYNFYIQGPEFLQDDQIGNKRLADVSQSCQSFSTPDAKRPRLYIFFQKVKKKENNNKTGIFRKTTKMKKFVKYRKAYGQLVMFWQSLPIYFVRS